jgi:hypothetical protein
MRSRLAALLGVLGVMLALPLAARANGVSPTCIPTSSTPFTVTFAVGPMTFWTIDVVTFPKPGFPIIPVLSNVVFTPAGVTATATLPAGMPNGEYEVLGIVRLAQITELGPLGIGPNCGVPQRSTSTSVSCSPSTFAPGGATVCTATVSDTASGAGSTPSGTVSFVSSGAGGFGGSPCTLSGSGASASCRVFFTSLARGGQVITAGYGGDPAHGTSVGSTLVSVSVPASTSGCVVFGHGRITAADGDRASFRGLAVGISPAVGAEIYRDWGPSNGFRVVSSRMDAVTCSARASAASVFGTARVNGIGSVPYRIDVQLTAGERDTYRIRLGNGYDSGTQQIHRGNVHISLRSAEHHHRNRRRRPDPGRGS